MRTFVPPMHLLSKSTYLRGKQCPKALWLYKHRPELRPAVSVAQQAIFDSGTEVESMAQGGGGASSKQGCRFLFSM